MTTFINACETFEIKASTYTHVYTFKDTANKTVTVCVLPNLAKNADNRYTMDFTNWDNKVAEVQKIASDCFYNVANYRILQFSDFTKNGKNKPLVNDRREMCKIFFKHYLKHSKAKAYKILLFEEKSQKRNAYFVINGFENNENFVTALSECLEISTKSDGKDYSLRFRVNGTNKFDMFKPFVEKIYTKEEFASLENNINYPKNAKNNGLKWEYLVYTQNHQNWTKDNKEFFKGADITIRETPYQLKTQKSTFVEFVTFKNNAFLTWTD